MVVLSGKVTVELGAASNDKETITNIKEILWKRVPEAHIRPQTVMNTVNPIGWYKGHKWVHVILRSREECYEAFYHNGTGNVAYIVEEADNVKIPYMKAIMRDQKGKEWTATFTDAIVDSVEEPYADGKDTIFTFVLKAKKVVIAKPA